MTRRLLAYALLADGVLVALFDGGYVRLWRPMVPDRVVSATRRVSQRSTLLRLIGIAEVAAGLVLLSMMSMQAGRAVAPSKPHRVTSLKRRAA
ncbi:MAG: hypothetical protein ACYC1U_04090 [Candidatus Aquicultorales bacterium]